MAEDRSTEMRRREPHASAGEEVLRLAGRHNIPLRQDPALAAALSQLDPGVSAPPELFRAVAEVLAFVYKVNGK